MKRFFTRIISSLVAFVILFSLIPANSVFADYQSTPTNFWDKQLQHYANNADSGLGLDFADAFSGSVCSFSPDRYHHAESIYGCTTGSDKKGSYANARCKYCGSSFKYYSNDLRATYQLQNVPGNGYYTQPTTTTVDNVGNTTNYYRSGPTSNISLVNSGNKTFNSYQSNSYTTNNNTNYYKYQANIDLSNFLNTYNYNYVTNNYDVDYNYYTYNYTTNNYTFYLIDNSTTNYNYDVDVTYAPSYTQVTYISKDETHNNVTNIYYYSLYDGRSSFYLTKDEISGMDTGYDAVNYETLRDDDSVLSLQHFDGSYADSSGFSREYYAEPSRSWSYLDVDDFGQAIGINGHSVGVTIPDLDAFTNLCVEFRMFNPKPTDDLAFSLVVGGTSVYDNGVILDTTPTSSSGAFFYYDHRLVIWRNTPRSMYL